MKSGQKLKLMIAIVSLAMLIMSSNVFAFHIGYDKVIGNLGNSISCESDSMYPTISCMGMYDAQYPKMMTDRWNMSIGTIVMYSAWLHNFGLPKDSDYRIPSNFITHRIVDKGLDNLGIYYITKGDNNDYTDFDMWDIKIRPRWIMFEVLA